MGVPRSGAKIERTLERALGPMKLRTTEDERGSFYWKMRQDPETYDCYRVPEEGGFKRSMEDICLEEIVCALMEVLEHQISIPRTDLMKEVAKKFGYTRLSSAIERAVNLAIEKAVEKKGVVVSEDGDRISLGDA